MPNNAGKQVQARINLPIATTALWGQRNPVLLKGEIGFEITGDGSVFAKVGDGETAWSSLPYISVPTATQAGKLQTTKTIDGVDFDGSVNISHYGVCETEAATAAKTVSCTGFRKQAGAWIVIAFSETNTADNATLNVNNTGAASIMYQGTAIPKSQLAAGRLRFFIYDGTNYEFVGDINTTHNTMSGADASTAGRKGLVPAPAAGDQEKFLRGDGTWSYPVLAEIVVSQTAPANPNAIWFKID